MPEALTVSQFALWVVVLALSVVVLGLVRQIGVLHERIAPMGALTIDRGPKVGESAPMLELADIAGRTVRVGGAQDSGTLLLFVSPTCPVCKKLIPIARSMVAAESPAIELVLASDGEAREHERFVRGHHLNGLPYVLSSELGMTYRIGKLPYAVLIDENGVLRAKGLVNTREHLESLLQARDLGVASIQEYLKVTHPPNESNSRSASIGKGGI
jgi:methylamine dehydrogenase accessory protein MauD